MDEASQVLLGAPFSTISAIDLLEAGECKDLLTLAKKELEETSKKQAEEKLQVFEEIKKDLQVKKEKKQRKQKAKEIKQIMQELSSEESDADSDVEQAEIALRELLAKRAKREKRSAPEPEKVLQEFPAKHVPLGGMPPKPRPQAELPPMRLPTSGMANLRFC